MLLIAGLGNPGIKYKKTRHNIGMIILDSFIDSFAKSKKFTAEIAQEKIMEQEVIFVKPETFMNASGESIKKISAFYKIEPQNILVIHDDLDLLPGTMKFSFQKSSAGHKGVESTIQNLGTDAFNRLRIGIGKPLPPTPSESFVIANFSKEEQKIIKENLPLYKEAILNFIQNGINSAMNKYN